MRILTVKNPSNFFSKLITKATGEEASHIIIELSCGFVIHSAALGPTVEVGKKYYKDHDIVDVAVPIVPIPDSIIVDKYVKYEGRPYDYGAILFHGVRYAGLRWFNIPLGKRNLWADSGAYMCTEFVTDVINEKQDAIITPGQVIEKLIKSGKFVRIK